MANWRAVGAVLAVVVAFAAGACSQDHSTSQPEGVPVDEQSLKAALKKEFKFSPDTTRIDHAPEVPGLIVFSAHDTGREGRQVTGVFDGHTIERDFRTNFARVLTALGVDDSQRVSATVVAQTIGMLEGDPGTPIVDPDALHLLRPDVGYFLPRYTTIDGHTAVEYWVSSRMAPWRTSIVVQPDHTYEYRRNGEVQ
jgi:hypothetical protein